MSKRKVSQEDSNEINSSIYNHLVSQGLGDVAKSFLKESKLDKKNISTNAPELSEVLTFFKTNHTNGNATKKAKVEATKKAASSSDESSSSSSESEDEKPAAKSVPVKAVTKMDVESDSDSSSSSSSDSEDEAPKRAVVSKPVAKKPSSSSSSSSDSDSESSEDEKPAAKPAAKPTPVKATPVKKAESSDSESDSDSESEEEEKPKATPAKATPAKPVVASTPKSENGKEHKIFVTGLPWAATEYEVREFFQGCGSVMSAELPLGENGKSSGTAYVKFASREELDAALALDGQTWPGTERWLKIREGIDKPERRSFGGGEPSVKPEGCDTVFVGNLPYEVDEQQMRAVFEQAGEISNVRFASNEDGSFRGFGHVSFYNPDDVDNAVKLAGSMIGTRAIRVDYAPPRTGGGGRGGGGRGRGDGGRGGRDGGRGRGRGGGRSPANPAAAKNKGSIVAGAGKKMSFDE